MKRFSIILIGVILCAMLSQTGSFAPIVHAAADSVPPEADGWVQVSTAEQLAYIDENQALYLSRSIQLMNDIDMSGYHWIPFGGNGEDRFSGIFDGRGYQVSGIQIPITSLQYVGFFGQSFGTIKNLGIIVDIEGGTFNNAGTTATGGLIGELDGGSIDRCYVHGKVIGVNATSGLGAIGSITGGMVGEARNSSITNSFSTATVSGGSGPNEINGGLVGAQGAGTISNVYARGEISNTGDQYVDIGGLIGFMVYGTIDKAYATGNVSSHGSGAHGGLTGSLFVNTNIWKSYFDTEATGLLNGIGSYYEGASEAYGQTTNEMKQQSTYSGWDFVHTWAMHASVNDGYPFLRPSILTTALPTADKEVPYAFTLTAFDGASGGLTWEASELPAGMSLSSNGVLQGTPQQSGSFNIEITATDAGYASATAMLQLNVKELAPDINNFQIGQGGAIGTTHVTALPSQSDHSFAYTLSSSENARPFAQDALPAEATIYTLGSDISNVHTGQYLNVYELDANLLIQAWHTVQLTDAHILSGIPIGLQATAEDEKVDLAWESLQEADSYRIYKYEGNDLPADPNQWVLVNESEVTEAAYLVNDLTAGKHYWFSVTSVINEEESGFSNPVAAIPYTTVTETVPLEDIQVGKGIELDELKNHVPEKVQIYVSNAALLDVNVSWDWEHSDYDPDQAGTYKVVGQLQLQEHVRNPASLQVELSIVVLKDTNARLNGIYLDDVLLQGFQSDVFTYTIEVPYETERLMVTAETYDATATYEVLGGHAQTLEIGDNPLKILVTAEDQKEQMTYTINVARKADNEAPQWLDGSELTVSEITQTNVLLSWSSATDNAGVSGYRIYVNDVERKLVSSSVYAATIDGLKQNTTYTFKVVAFDAEGNESEALRKQATTDQVKESAPEINALQIAPGSAVGTTNVTAKPDESDHSFAYILSSFDNERPLVGDTLPAEATMYTLGSDIPNVHTGQYLNIYELDANFLIQAWHTVQLTDAHILSGIPIGLQATDEEEKVNLVWEPLQEADSYRIYKYEGNNLPADPNHWVLVNESEVTEATYLVNHLTSGKPYWFSVTSVINGEESDFSNPVAAIPYTTVTEVVPLEDIQVGKGIELDELKNHVPEKVQVYVSNAALLDVNVNWDWEHSDYDPDQAATYKVVGQLQLQEHVRNPASLQVELSIVVLKDTNARLNGIYLDDVLLQGFQPDVFTYTIEVPYETERLMVTAETYDATATYEVLGGHAQTLKIGDNPLKILVTAEDQKEQMTYTINVTRKADNKAPQWPDGSELTVSEITQTNVKLSWSSATDNAGVSGYRIYVNDVERKLVSSSVYAATIDGLKQNTTYTFKVVAFDAEGNESEALHKQATTTRSSAGGSYVLSNNANLTDLQIWGEVEQLKLSPAFASETTEYTAQTEAEQVEIAAIKAHVMAKVTLNDNVITDRVKVNLTDGDNILVLTVHAENGTKKEYTLIIHREIIEPAPPLIEFTDISGHWAEGYIKQAVEQEIISGYPSQLFKPDNAVTRAEFTVMLVDALNLDGESAALMFTDNDQIGQWAKRAIALALQMEIINGYKDGSFRPDTQITRAEMASMIAKALQLPRNTNTATSFADDGDIPTWAKGAVEAIHKLGIVNGRGGNKFVPNDTATRSEAVVMLLNMLEVWEQK